MVSLVIISTNSEIPLYCTFMVKIYRVQFIVFKWSVQFISSLVTMPVCESIKNWGIKHTTHQNKKYFNTWVVYCIKILYGVCLISPVFLYFLDFCVNWHCSISGVQSMVRIFNLWHVSCQSISCKLQYVYSTSKRFHCCVVNTCIGKAKRQFQVKM